MQVAEALRERKPVPAVPVSSLEIVEAGGLGVIAFYQGPFGLTDLVLHQLNINPLRSRLYGLVQM